MFEVTIEIGDLFSAVEKVEKINLVENQEYFQKAKIQIQDEHNNWIDVKALLKKPKDTIHRLSFSDNSILECADKHLISDGKDCVYAQKVRIGHTFQKANGKMIYCNSNEVLSEKEEIYDIMVDSPTHLYQTADGLVHHNTAIIKAAWEKHHIKYRYFSAPTMDPWVDFIGIPKEKRNEETGESYLDLVRPLDFQRDEIEAIFLDEFNRAPKKVKNAVMELMQFKSINGFKFNNLKMIWAAINPEDDEDHRYDVEPMDTAQKDRFHFIVNLPYQPDAEFFEEKYDSLVSQNIIAWWEAQPKKDLISPRRLDYAVDIYRKGGKVDYVFPEGVNIKSFRDAMNSRPVEETLMEFFTAKNVEKAGRYINTPNEFLKVKEYLLDKKKKFEKQFLDFYVPLFSKENLIVLMTKSENLCESVFDMAREGNVEIEKVVGDLAKSKASDLSDKATKVFEEIAARKRSEFYLEQNKELHSVLARDVNVEVKALKDGNNYYVFKPMNKDIGKFTKWLDEASKRQSAEKVFEILNNLVSVFPEDLSVVDVKLIAKLDFFLTSLYLSFQPKIIREKTFPIIGLLNRFYSEVENMKNFNLKVSHGLREKVRRNAMAPFIYLPADSK